jgi:hypothetical protein
MNLLQTTRGVAMSHTDTALRAAGVWLAVAAVLLAGVFVGHGPIDPDMSVQMEKIAASPVQWAIVHWAAAASLSLFAVAGLIILTARSRLTEEWWTISAWAVVTMGALLTMTTAVAEATVVAGAAAAGDLAIYEPWWAFSEGKANGFMFLALAVAAIAANEARAAGAAVPAWSCRIAVAAGLGAFLGWPIGMWLGFAPGSLLWAAASFVMALWTLWFGLGLTGAVVASRARLGANGRA